MQAWLSPRNHSESEVKSMQANQRTERRRRQELTAIIDRYFGEICPEELDFLAGHYSESITEMFEVLEIDHDRLTFGHLFDEKEFKNVLAPEEIQPLIRLHDVFLATLVREDDSWEVIYLSPPYEEVAFH
jgi:hypothetical protein